jgi:hypothetical protein
MKKALLCLLTVLVFSGCNIGITADSLLTPPKLSEDQALVYDALVRAAGKDIVLKYPRAGQHRSAVTITDIDNDGGNEAVAFYQKTGDSAGDSSVNGSVRVNILDIAADGRWYSVYDHAGAGSDIDRLIISTLGGGRTPLLAVGFLMLSGTKTARIYSYTDNRLSGEFSDNYSSMFTADIDRDNRNELCLIHPNTAEKQAYISLISVDGNLIYEWGTANLNPLASEFLSIASGALTPDTAALYIDSADGEFMHTDIVYSPVSGRLRNPMYLEASMLTNKTERPIGLSTADIDSDGTLEIPVLSVFPGVTGNESVSAVNWMVLENYEIVKKYNSFYNDGDGYCFLFPQRWDGVVTVRTDSRTGESVFCRFVPGMALTDMPELMRVAVTERSTVLVGYNLVTTRDNFNYWVKSADTHDEPLILTDTEIDNNFCLL